MVKVKYSLLLILMVLLVSIGCSKQTVVYAGFGSVPNEAMGVIRIATNTPIEVTIVGEKDIYTSKNLGGYYVISATDLKSFVYVMEQYNASKTDK